MGMDRNTIIGFVLIGALLVAMLVVNNRSSQAYQEQKQHFDDSVAKVTRDKAIKDSLEYAKQHPEAAKPIVTAAAVPTALKTDSVEKLTTVENDVMRITFTNKGAQPKSVELLKFSTYDKKPLLIQTGNFNKISYKIKAGGSTANTDELFFTGSEVKVNTDQSKTIIFSIKDTSGKDVVTHQFTLPAPGNDGYMLDFNIGLGNNTQAVDQNLINLSWQTEAPQVEKTIKYQKQQTHIAYYTNNKYDFTALGSGGNEHFDKPVDWLAVNPQFFVSALLAKNKFKDAEIRWTVPDDSIPVITQSTAECRVDVPTDGNVALQLYYGPNDYNILDKYHNNMYQIVTYGSGPFSFVKYINRHFLLPIWDFIRAHVASYGIVILLLTLLIRLITSPILYKSYLSGAKMKVLKPEVDALKQKFTDKSGTLDQQAFSVEQMKLWRSAGVSPLGGCLPAVLQIPIFMSLYYFFQSNIALRGQGFLWANDLAAYDSIWNFGNVPVISSLYGDHMSLFTITATVTSLLISLYSMSNMQDNSNPLMKYMPYIFPVLLLGVFNRLPSALTWYYTVSNTITLILQIVIQKYIIDHDKIMAQITEKRKQPVKQSKWQEKFQAMQESQKRLQELKDKNSKK
ncbi:MAG: membrane protein insertase YidC [Bacteroidetes bacterium]|nr:membrane protein insertase YidC [Bacteroidota bacterium]